MSATAFCPPDARLVHPEVVRDFVPDRVADDLFRVLDIAGGSEDGFSKNRDFIGQDPVIMRASRGLWHAFVKAEKRRVAPEPELPPLLWGRLVFNNHGHICELREEFLRDGLESFGDK